jgi:hypothetical protein
VPIEEWTNEELDLAISADEERRHNVAEIDEAENAPQRNAQRSGSDEYETQVDCKDGAALPARTLRA